MDVGERQGAWRDLEPVEWREGRLLLDAWSQGQRKQEGC